MPDSVFITGANGFVGRALADRYRGAGVQVRGVDTVADLDAGVVAGDITSPSEWRHAIQGADVVIHTAAIVSNNIETARAWDVNVVGTQRVLEAATDAGVKRFVQISTMGVTRFAHINPAAARRSLPNRELDERWPLMPTGNPYTDTKIAAEHLVLAAHAAREQECVVIRPADIYGPGCRPWVLEPIKAMRDNRFLLPARGQGLFTPIFIDDLVDGVMAAATHPQAIGQIFHIGGESPVTTLEYFGYLSRMLGRIEAPRSAATAVAVAAAEAARLVAKARGRHTELGRGVMMMLAKTRGVSNEKARRVLGWEPKVDLAEGMRQVEYWLRSQGHLDA